MDPSSIYLITLVQYGNKAGVQSSGPDRWPPPTHPVQSTVQFLNVLYPWWWGCEVSSGEQIPSVVGCLLLFCQTWKWPSPVEPWNEVKLPQFLCDCRGTEQEGRRLLWRFPRVPLSFCSLVFPQKMSESWRAEAVMCLIHTLFCLRLQLLQEMNG